MTFASETTIALRLVCWLMAIPIAKASRKASKSNMPLTTMPFKVDFSQKGSRRCGHIPMRYPTSATSRAINTFPK
jgi:hypothetical protein